MDLTRENLAEVFKGFQAKFNAGMQRGRAAGNIPAELLKYRITLNDLAVVVPSTGAVEVHAWLNQVPGFVEWIGERTATELNFEAMKVANRKFHQTVEVPVDAIEDDKIGVYGPRFEFLGAEANDDAFWLDLAIAALLNMGNWADGVPFFGVSRSFDGTNAIVNATADSLSKAAVLTAHGRMASFKGSKGRNIAFPTMLLTSVADFPTARKICEFEKIVESDTQVDNDARGLLVPRMHEGISQGTWFVLGANAGIKGVCVQQRNKGDQLVRLDSADSDPVFNRDVAVYGSKARGEAFATFPHLVYRGGVALAAKAPKAKAEKAEG